MRNVLDKSCKENENTHFIFNNSFRKLHPSWHHSEKYGGERGATNGHTVWHISTWVVCLITLYESQKLFLVGLYAYIEMEKRW